MVIIIKLLHLPDGLFTTITSPQLEAQKLQRVHEGEIRVTSAHARDGSDLSPSLIATPMFCF